jgi:hypothetical protein
MSACGCRWCVAAVWLVASGLPSGRLVDEDAGHRHHGRGERPRREDAGSGLRAVWLGRQPASSIGPDDLCCDHYDHVVRRTNLPAPSAAGSWEALVLDLERPTHAGLLVQVAGRGRLALRQHGAVALLAKVRHDRIGVEYVRTDHFRSPIAPIRATDARAIGEPTTDGAWHARWAHQLATALAESTTSPLHTGSWAIGREGLRLRSTPRAQNSANRWTDLLLTESPGFIDWFVYNGSWQILPLRRLVDPDAGRVKSYRKQAREGILPPVLLWWISGLDCYVVLDGHDRLVAAATEAQEPPLLALSAASRRQVTDDTDVAVTRYTATVDALQQQVDAGTPGSVEALAAVTRQFASTIRRIETAYGTTRAWPLPGGTAAWNDLARTHSSDWFAEDTEINEGPEPKRDHPTTTQAASD